MEDVCPAGGIRVGEADLQTLLNGPSEEAEDLSVGSWGVDSGLNVQLALQGGVGAEVEDVGNSRWLGGGGIT